MTTTITACDRTDVSSTEFCDDLAKRRAVLQGIVGGLFQELGGEPLSKLGATIKQEKQVPQLIIEVDGAGNSRLEIDVTLATIEMLLEPGNLSIQIAP